jgi:predicted nucleic acid-binding Zn ribbon protein
MPKYEFRCPDGTIIERVFKMSEVPDAIPSPDGDGLAVRIISGGADLIFKGSGFYITDYGKDGKKAQRERAEAGAKADTAKPDAAPKADGGGKSDGEKTEKPAAGTGKTEKKTPSSPASPGGSS